MSFQFTPLREGRPYIASKAPTDDLFQFTPLREGRPAAKRQLAGGTDFNSRPCVRGDQYTQVLTDDFAKFQFTPLREGRRGKHSRQQKQPYFNSRPCVRGDDRRD